MLCFWFDGVDEVWPSKTWLFPLMYLAMFLDHYDDNSPRSEDRELMSDSTVENLILNLLEWLADGERSYEDVICAWRTSCPRLPVWEDANDRGLVTVVEANGRCVVRITRLGLALVDRRGSKNPGRAMRRDARAAIES